MSDATAAASAIAPAFLIDRIMPVRQVHLISGPSGSGISTLLLQILDDWRRGLPVFSFPSIPAPYYLISCDRPAEHFTTEVMPRMGIDPSTVPYFSTVDTLRPHDDHRGELSLEEIVSQVLRADSRVRVLFIDGFSVLCPGKIIDHNEVKKFLLSASHLCRTRNLTIVGTVYAAKAREGEGYANPRDRMLGSGAWSAFTGCKWVIEPESEPSRKNIHILSHSLAPIKSTMQHDEATARFVPAQLDLSSQLDLWLATVDEDAIITTGQVVLVAERLSISERSAKRWISAQLELGTLHRIDRGEYRKSSPKIT